MKQPKRGQTPSSKRSRRRDGANDPAAVNKTTGRDEVMAMAPVTPESEATIGSAEAAATAAVPAKSDLAIAGAIAEPVTLVADPVAQHDRRADRSAALHDVAVAPSALASASSSPRARADQIVKDHLPLAVGAGMLPIPGLDLAALGGLQLKLLASLAKHYNVRFTQAQAQLIVTSLLGSVGTTLLAGAVLGSVAKFVPFVGTLVGAASMPVAAGLITRAMGNLAIEHFAAGGTMETFDLDVAQQAFLKKIAEARAALA